MAAIFRGSAPSASTQTPGQRGEPPGGEPEVGEHVDEQLLDRRRRRPTVSAIPPPRRPGSVRIG